MQAVILAGGLGTRLRPLTYTRPKPLLPIGDRTMVDHIISSLPPEVDRVVLAVSYMKDALEKHFSRRGGGPEVVIVNEEEPLGTGGAVKNVEGHLDDTFLVYNGDIISSIDVGAMVAAHRAKGGAGTIALWSVEDPSRFGVVDIDGDMRIHRFLEKVPREEAPSNLINAGVYVLEPSVLDLMEPSRRTSIEREVFPEVVGMGLYGFTFPGYWVDAGTPASFLEAQGCVLSASGDVVAKGVAVDGAEMRAPVHISEGCRVGRGVVLGPNVFLGRGAVVGDRCRVEGSAIFDGCAIGDGAVVTGSLVGWNARVEKGARVTDTVVAEGDVVKGA